MVSSIRLHAIMALTILSVSASPVGSDIQVGPRMADATLDKRAAFQFRFYSNGGCDHSSSASSTWPDNGDTPAQGELDTCFCAPTGVNWNRLEIDQLFSGNVAVQTYCNINCQGGVSPKQQNTHCFEPAVTCAIGSFKVVTS